MEEAEKLCDRVAIMDSGTIVTIDSPENLMALHGGNLENVYLKLTGEESCGLGAAFIVWQRHWLVYTKLYKTSFALNFIEPALYLVAMGFGLGAFVQNIHVSAVYTIHRAGIVASSSVFAAVYECTYGTYIRMTFQKTFDAILATPVNLDELVAGELIWGATKSVIFGITIMFVIALFGLVSSWRIVLAIPFVFLGGLILPSFGPVLRDRAGHRTRSVILHALHDTVVPLFRHLLPPRRHAADGRPPCLHIAALSPCQYLPRLFSGQYKLRNREHGMAARCCCPSCPLALQAHEKKIIV